MKLLYVLSAILAITLAKEVNNIDEIEDSELAASANVELLKKGVDLDSSASVYSYVPHNQNTPQWPAPPNNWPQPKPEVRPENHYGQPPNNVQNDYYWSTPIYHQTTTTTPVPVIKNEQYIGDHGDYKYEYQIGDGTHVGEQGWFTSPNHEESSLVKKGWYSYIGADGRTYTVTYWADKTGFHAYGDHLPTPPPVPAAIQAALDKQKEDEKYKPHYDTPVQDTPVQDTPVHNTPAPHPAYPTKPAYVPTQPPYVPSQPSYVPSQPAYIPTQPPYAPSQPAYVPPVYETTHAPSYNPTYQPTYRPPSQYIPQQNYYPQQHQTYYPQQQQQQQQSHYVPQYNV